MDMNERVTNGIRRKMKEQGITQVELSEQLGISRPNLSRLLAGRSPRVPDSLQRVLDHLGLELTVEDKDA
jgi:transcriptional regulator with XRE-family HTH domain